jgi:hypothetical protein
LKNLIFFGLFFGLLYSTTNFAADLNPVKSQYPQKLQSLRQLKGLKFPNTISEGTEPVASSVWAPQDPYSLGGFNELIPYITAAPDQEEANSCLYMSLTGIAEFWLMRSQNNTRFDMDGDFDLSERWWMNQSVYTDNLKRVNNAYTDTIYLFNEEKSAFNRDYRFTKGWYKETKDDDIVKAKPGAPGAKYDAVYNWFDDTDKVKKRDLITLPKFYRDVIYKDSEENPWNIGEAPANIVEKIKESLVKYKSPVHVIYNHQGYWHAVVILGFDDNMNSNNCPFVKESQDSFQEEADKSRLRAQQAKSESEKQDHLKRARKFDRYKRELTTSFNKNGGCKPEGVFYVRDSQYSDPTEPMYHYDLNNPSADTHLSKRIIFREYAWAQNMINHATSISIYPYKGVTKAK